MRITDVTTTHLHASELPGIQDATIRHRGMGRGALFVHIETDEGHEGLGVGTAPGARGLIERELKELLIGEDPLAHERLWEELFWRVRGFGRKGLAFCAISAIDIGLWDLKAKIFGVPLYRLLGPYTDRVPIYGSGGWTSFDEGGLVREQAGYKVAHLAHAFNLPVAPHAVQLVHLHLACCTPNLKVVEYLGTAEETDRIWYTEFPEPKDGMWSPYPDRPGLGLELDPRAVRKYAV